MVNSYEYGIMSTEKFKGKEFLNLDVGNLVSGGMGPEGGPPTKLPDTIDNYYSEVLTRHPNSLDISRFDPNLYGVNDNTKIDGNMQSIDYIKDHKDVIKTWFEIKEGFNVDELDDDTCIIHIRGGDFMRSSAVLGSEYYQRGVKYMLEQNSNMKFAIVTDDVNYANRLLPEIPIIGGSATNTHDKNKAGHHIGGPIWMDWLILNKCKNAIISASSFSFWPIWLNSDIINVIAPMYWADYKKSDGYWSCGDSLIENWTYLHRNGNVYDYDMCDKLKKEYETNNKNLWL
jgi:hypothetical protein